MVDIGTALEGLFGQLRFYAALDRKLFAEIKIEEGKIDIKIINSIVTIEAMLIHLLKKKRVGSAKLLDLKKAGFDVTIRYGPMKYTL